jgi:hypothetical protein
MASMRIFLLLFLVIGFASRLEAWGPTLEPLKGGSSSSTALHQAREKGFEEGECRPERYDSDVKPAFTLHYLRQEGLDLDPILKSIINPKVPLWDPVDSLFAMEDDCVGEDCEEECLIPEEYKSNVSFDVMAYLGIQRAEPVRIETFEEGVWE